MAVNNDGVDTTYLLEIDANGAVGGGDTTTDAFHFGQFEAPAVPADKVQQMVDNVKLSTDPSKKASPFDFDTEFSPALLYVFSCTECVEMLYEVDCISCDPMEKQEYFAQDCTKIKCSPSAIQLDFLENLKNGWELTEGDFNYYRIPYEGNSVFVEEFFKGLIKRLQLKNTEVSYCDYDIIIICSEMYVETKIKDAISELIEKIKQQLVLNNQ